MRPVFAWLFLCIPAAPAAGLFFFRVFGARSDRPGDLEAVGLNGVCPGDHLCGLPARSVGDLDGLWERRLGVSQKGDGRLTDSEHFGHC